MRRLFDQNIFGRMQMEDYLVHLTEPTVNYLVDRIEKRLNAGESVELCRDLALPMTYKSISSIIGVPERLFAEFIELGDAAFGFVRDPQRAMEAVEEMGAHFRTELEDRRSRADAPRD